MSSILFEDWEAQQRQDPSFREIAESLEPGHQIARRRIQHGRLAELAERVG